MILGYDYDRARSFALIIDLHSIICKYYALKSVQPLCEQMILTLH